MQKTIIILPCFNEEIRIKEPSIENLILNSKLDIIFANDGSVDKTLEIIKNIVKKHPKRCYYIDYKKNTGKANTIYETVNYLLKNFEYDFIGFFDADFSTPPVEIINLNNIINSQKLNLVFGSRVKILNSNIKRKFFRHFIGRILITLIDLRFKLGIYDTQCGAKIFTNEIAKKIFKNTFYTSWLFDIEIFLRLKKANELENCKEVLINNWQDIEGSKLGLKSFFKISKEFFLLLKNY